MNRLFISFVVLLLSVTAHAQFLPEINFDSLTEILKNPTGVITFSADLYRANTEMRQAKDVFNELKDTIELARLNTPADYRNMAMTLLDLREEYRHSRQSKIDQRRTLFMIEMMAEDVLYVAKKKFGDRFDNAVIKQDEGADDARVAKVEGLYVQTGDIMVSKAVGSGSSDFIAFLSQVPQIFSHSTPVWVNPQSLVPMSPEALINDGVKLRDLEPEYASKARIYVYRNHGSGHPNDEKPVRAAITAATDAFVKTMYDKVADPTIQAAYLYDMSFGGDDTDKTFVCSAVARHIYATIPNIKVEGRSDQYMINPYDKRVWSKFNSRSDELLQALSIKVSAVPSPGDVEMNRFFNRVGYVIRADRLEQERIEAAIVDYTLDYLGSDRAHQALEFLEHLKSVKSDDLVQLEQLKIIPQDQMLKLKSALDQVPAGVGMNQIAFFYFMDSVWTPMVRTEVLKQIGGPDQIVGLDATYEIVAKTVKRLWKEKYQALQQYIAAQHACAAALQKPPATP